MKKSINVLKLYNTKEDEKMDNNIIIKIYTKEQERLDLTQKEWHNFDFNTVTLHRTDGPSVIWYHKDGSVECEHYYINDQYYHKENYYKELDKISQENHNDTKITKELCHKTWDEYINTAKIQLPRGIVMHYNHLEPYIKYELDVDGKVLSFTEEEIKTLATKILEYINEQIF